MVVTPLVDSTEDVFVRHGARLAFALSRSATFEISSGVVRATLHNADLPGKLKVRKVTSPVTKNQYKKGGQTSKGHERLSSGRCWAHLLLSLPTTPNCRSRLVVREIKKAMKKSDVPSATGLFSGVSLLESVKALLSLIVFHTQEEAKGKRTLAMYDLSRAHVRGVPVRRVFVELRTGRKRRSRV